MCIKCEGRNRYKALLEKFIIFLQFLAGKTVDELKQLYEKVGIDYNDCDYGCIPIMMERLIASTKFILPFFAAFPAHLPDKIKTFIVNLTIIAQNMNLLTVGSNPDIALPSPDAFFMSVSSLFTQSQVLREFVQFSKCFVSRDSVSTMCPEEHAKFLAILNFFETKSADEILGFYSRAERLADGPSPSDILDTLTFIKELVVEISAYFRPCDFDVTEELKSRIQRSLTAAEKIGLLTIETDKGDVPDFLILLENLGYIYHNFLNLKRFVKYFKKFTHYPVSETEAEDALKAYIKTGEKIRLDPKFPDSPVERLEKLVVDMPKTVTDTIKGEGKYPTDLLFTRTFIALVTPGLCGKTQSAFALKNVRPLYFVMKDSQQKVSFNFASLVKTLEECAKKDIEAIKADEPTYERSAFETKRVKVDSSEYDGKAVVDNNPIEQAELETTIYADLSSVYVRVNMSCTKHTFFKKRSFVLGFLMELMMEAEKEYKPGLKSNLFPDAEMSWMEFHAQRTGPRGVFHFESMTIEDAQKKPHLFSKYFLFLDEFVGYPWAVLVRNICRVVGIRVVVANSDPEIANYTGRKLICHSRGSGRLEALSLVITRLNEPTFDSTDTNISIVCVDDERERDAMREFISDLVNNQLQRLRPGIVHMVLDTLKKLEREEGPFSVCQVLDRISNVVGLALKDCKPGINALANLGLMLGNAYAPVHVYRENPLLHQISHLNDHFYYLRNPVDDVDWLFMTFRLYDICEKLFIHKNRDVKRWLEVETYFDKNEWLAILACISILPNRAVIDDLKKSDNNESAIRQLDILSTFAVSDSSHHGDRIERSGITLAGQTGVTFANNLIYHLKDNNNEQGNLSISSLTAPSVLESFKVPFLYASNAEVPLILQDLTRRGVINVGECKRTINHEKISFQFEIEILAGARRLALIDCEYWQNDVQMTQLEALINKAAETQEIYFNAIVCKSILDRDNWNEMKSFGKSHGCNIYKLQRINESIQWSPVFETTGTSSLIVLIYEREVINCMGLRED